MRGMYRFVAFGPAHAPPRLRLLGARALLNEAQAAGDPVIAMSDDLAALPQTMAPDIDAPSTALGTDCFGHGDTWRALPRFFEVDRDTMSRWSRCTRRRTQWRLPGERLQQAIERYGLNTEPTPPSPRQAAQWVRARRGAARWRAVAGRRGPHPPRPAATKR